MKKLCLLLLLCIVSLWGYSHDAQAARFVNADLGDTVYSDVSQILDEEYPHATQVHVSVGENKSLRINSEKITSVIIESSGMEPVTIIGAPNLKTVAYNTSVATTLDFSDTNGYENVSWFKLYSEDQLQTLTLPEMKNLKTLWINGAIQSIDLNENKTLEEVDFTDTAIPSISFKGYKKLEEIHFYCELAETNPLKKINVSGCKSLRKLFLASTEVTSLDVRKCPKLKAMTLGASLTKLKVQKKQAFNSVNVGTNVALLKKLNANVKKISFSCQKKTIRLRKLMPWLTKKTTYKISPDSMDHYSKVDKKGVITGDDYCEPTVIAKQRKKKITFEITLP